MIVFRLYETVLFQQFFSSLPNKTGLYGRRDTHRGPPYSSRIYGYRDSSAGSESADYYREENNLNSQNQGNDYYGSPVGGEATSNYDSQNNNGYDSQREYSYGSQSGSNYRGNQGQSFYDEQNSSSYYGNQGASSQGNSYSNTYAGSPYRGGRPYGSSYDIFDAPGSAYGPKNGSERCIPKCFAEKGNRVKYHNFTY